MRMPMTARRNAPRFALTLTAVFIGACSADSTAPSTAAPPAGATMVVPGASSKALVGGIDGTYVVVFDPRVDQTFAMGPNTLKMPANSVCNLLTSGYGTSHWNQSCTPQTLPVTMTVTIKGSNGDKPQIDFLPAMRFNPAKNVQLTLYYSKANKGDADNRVMLYCPDHGKCIDESLTDASVKSFTDATAQIVWRRIKHFSGYVIAGGRDSEGGDQ
ncbi:MAG: hypothetical protein JWM95_2190 [Gemmatimonadetes bacterium]|nr:hypothetical protein [Gemmatimonadota bacterium]